jgi:GT2 family glycosyltransferase
VDTNRKSRPLSLKPFSTSRVDIIVPFHSQYERVSELIRSIIVSVKSNPYQITLVDDRSENKTFGEEIKRDFAKNTPEGYKPQVQYIRSEERLGFAGALKLGFESTENPWVLFMHSDCVVEDPNFMINMGQSLLNWRRAGVPVKMVSARSDNPCDLEAARAGRMEKGEADIVLEGETLPLFCAMCNRDLFRHIGGFIKEYPYAWYEDEELAHRMRAMGLKQGISTKAWVRHTGAATIKYVWENDPESKGVMEGNRERCLKDVRALKRATSAA